MDQYAFFSFCPKLKPHRIVPSEDDPKEFILIGEEDGASMGVNLKEHRLIELLERGLSIAECVKRITNENTATLTDLRRLIWDLDRYGFLETSPWSVRHDAGWGYWGRPVQVVKTFFYTSALGGAEKFFASLLAQPVNPAALFVLAWILHLFFRNEYAANPLLILNGSVAAALLAVIVSVTVALFLSSWLSAAVLHAVHPSPVRIVVEQRAGFYFLRTDGRRLRSKPLLHALVTAVSPLCVLFFLSGVLLGAGALSEGVRKQWLFHTSISFSLAAFLLLLPWFSTVLSRDVVLRLRGDSVFWTSLRAVRKAFLNLFRQDDLVSIHERLFLLWGVWSIVSSFFLIRLAAMIFRWDFPILVHHFLQEDDVPLLVTLFTLMGLVCVVLLVSVLTFLVWLLRELYRETENRLMPFHDGTCVNVMLAAVAFIVLQGIQFQLPPQIAVNGWLFILFGAVIAVLALRQWVQSGGGFEPLILLTATGLGVEIALYGWRLLHGQPALTPWIVWGVALLFWLVYVAIAFSTQWKIRSLHSMPMPWSILVLYAVAVLMLNFGVYASPQEAEFVSPDVQDRIVRSVLFIIAAAVTMVCGNFRNRSLLYFNAALLFTGQALFLPFPDSFASILLQTFGFSCALGGLLLRNTAALRLTSEAGHLPEEERFANAPVISRTLAHESEQFFQSNLRFKPPEADEDSSLRGFIQRLYAVTGPAALNVIARSAIGKLRWHEAQRLSMLLPPNLNLPPLHEWTDEKIIAYLRNVPTFMNAGDEVQEVTSVARLGVYETGETMIRQGLKEDDLLVLLQGRVIVESDHTFGHTRIALLSAGDFVGEIGFLSGAPRTASVRALERTVVLTVSRRHVGKSMPSIQRNVTEAEAGKSWQQKLSVMPLFCEFPTTLRARVCLESKHVYLETGKTLLMHHDENAHCIAVMLKGYGVFLRNDTGSLVEEGTIIGLDELLTNKPLRGVIRAEAPSHVLLVDRILLLEAVRELLTPKQVLEQFDRVSA